MKTKVVQHVKSERLKECESVRVRECEMRVFSGFQVFKNIPGSQLLSDIQTFFYDKKEFMNTFLKPKKIMVNTDSQ